MGITLKEGMEVKVTGYTEVYAPYGKLSFMAQYIVPIGEGALKLAFEKLKRELEQAGYFDVHRKRVLPPHIQNIGLITSDESAAQKDFLTHIGKHGYKIRFYDARVEGIKSVENIVQAIRWFNEQTSDTEVLVLTRGGGSLESLQAFNTLEVAKAIYSSKIPVLAAIGHEQDVTIADLVADVRASVPTHAGKMLGDPWEEAKSTIDTIERDIFSLFRNRCAGLKQQLGQYQSHFISSFANRLRERRKDIEGYQGSMMRCFKEMLRQVKRIEDNFNQNYERFWRQLKGERQVVHLNEQTLVQEGERFYARLESRLRLAQEQYAYNYIRFHRHLKSKMQAVHLSEQTLVQKGERFYAKLETRLKLAQEQYARSHARFARYLSYLAKDISRRQIQIAGEGRRWYLSLVKKIADSEKILLASDPQLKLK